MHNKKPELLSYDHNAQHYDLIRLPKLLHKHLPKGPLSLADLGCGDGPFFNELYAKGFISNSKPVYAVDLHLNRLIKIVKRYPFIITILSSVEHINEIPDSHLDFVISTMVLEHVKDEFNFVGEILRILKPGGKAFITTVFKKKWAWYFRKRNNETVLDKSHVREYTNLADVIKVFCNENYFCEILEMDLAPLFFPVLDPLFFKVSKANEKLFINSMIRYLRIIRVPIPGYYNLSIVIKKPKQKLPNTSSIREN